jgi:hypothetical protein
MRKRRYLAYQFLLWRTRLLMPLEGLLSSIHIMTVVAALKLNHVKMYFELSVTLIIPEAWTKVAYLSVVVPQVDLRRTTDGHTLVFTSVRLKQVRFHRLFDPDSLGACKGRHLVDIREIEFALLRLVVGREHVLLPGLSQQSLHDHCSLWQTFGPRPVVRLVLWYPATVDKNCRISLVSWELVCPVQGRHDLISRLSVMYSRSNEHLLIVS